MKGKNSHLQQGILPETPPQPLVVSVVMCTYNGAAYLEPQLQSVLAQTYPINEILIYDDSSTDATFSILERYAQQHPHIVLHRNPHNLGYIRNFEQAIQNASGEVIAICDQDDIWLPAKLEKMIAAWNFDSVLIYCYSYIFQGTPPVDAQPDRLVRRFAGTDGRKMCLYNTISGHACIFRRELLNALLPFPAEIIYDWWLAVVAAYNGGVQYLPQVLVYHRAHPGSHTLGGGTLSRQQVQDKEKQEIVVNNRLFASIPNLPQPHQQFFLRLSALAKESQDHRFYLPLFWFLFRYQHLSFYPHRLPYPILSQGRLSYLRTIS